jgi:hypothetical protein
MTSTIPDPCESGFGGATSRIKIDPPMATATRPPITKTRLSQLILEATALFVASVLLVWLLLWFLWQKPKLLTVKAFYASGGDVPYQKADSSALDSNATSSLPGPEALRARMKQTPSTQVIYLSAPFGVEDWTGDRWLLDRVKAVAESAQGNVLLVLDLAQIDSDREIEIFGNAPYRWSDKNKLATQEIRNRSANFFVLCSCAPGQKSWMADEAGRSIFAYYLEKGLFENAVTGADDPQSRSQNTSVEKLHHFVLQNVRQWVNDNRQATQTPWLLKVGGSQDFTLASVPREARINQLSDVSASLTAPKVNRRDAGPKDKASAKATPPEEAPKVDDPKNARRGELVQQVLKEWGAHDALKANSKLDPIRYAPAQWRQYETALLRAERLVRYAWNGTEDDQNVAASALKVAQAELSSMTGFLKERKDKTALFPFRPVLDDEEGKKQLQDALIYVANVGLPELDPVLSPAQAPAQGAPVPKAQPVAQQLAPDALLRADSDWPSPYLELQLPVWAFRFNKEFGVDFRDERGRLLREAVRYRLNAEAAIAHDRRGLDWIKNTIEKGDARRRQLQDRLFTADEVDESISRELPELGTFYDDARRRIDLYHKARSLFEQVAAELPYYGEWLILDRAHDRSGNSQPGTIAWLPTELSNAMDRTDELRLALDPENASGDGGQMDALSLAAERARSSLKDLKDLHDQRINDIRRIGNPEWWKIDEILRTPMIEMRVREELLYLVLRPNKQEPKIDPAPQSVGLDDYPVDSGFLKRAIGLAQLEIGLRKLSDDSRSDGLSKSLNLIKQACRNLLVSIAKQADAKADQAASPAAGRDDQILMDFATWTAAVRSEQGDSSTSPGDEDRTNREFAKLAGDLRAQDRAVRFLTANRLGKSRQRRDEATSAFEDHFRCDALILHANRLVQDYAPDVSKLINIARAIDEHATPREFKIPSGRLRVRAPSSIAIDKSGKADFQAQVEVERSDARDRLQPGQAFLGVVEEASSQPAPAQPKENEIPKGAASNKVDLELLLGTQSQTTHPRMAGDLVKIGGEPVLPKLSFQVNQKGSAEQDGERRRLFVKLFYRGRLDQNDQVNPRPETVTVLTRNLGEPISIVTRQNRELLRELYPRLSDDDIQDVFVRNPGHGYMHFGRELAYVITIQNRRPEPVNIWVQRTLEPLAGGEQQKLDMTPTMYPLGPMNGAKESCFVKGSISPDQVPIDKPQKMFLRVFKDERMTIPLGTEVIQFTQLRPEQYLSYEVKKVRGFLVYITHEQNCPVGEPISLADFQSAVGGQPPKKVGFDSYFDGFFKRGQKFQLSSEVPANDWYVIIDGARFPPEAKTGRPPEGSKPNNATAPR